MEQRSCEQCGASIGTYQAKARFCTGACKAKWHRDKKAFPAEMTKSRRWVCRTASKRPVTIEGKSASSTNPATWSTYEDARKSTAGVGLGFVLGNGIGCIDLDYCYENGALLDWAAGVIDRHRSEALLIERSQSGEGVHIFLPMQRGKGEVVRDGRNIETYPPDSGRYIAVTGDRI